MWGGAAQHMQATQTSPEGSALLLHATCYNTSLRRILTVVPSRFDPRATVQTTGLYNQTLDPLRQSILEP
jgi:hypothetical protein